MDDQCEVLAAYPHGELWVDRERLLHADLDGLPAGREPVVVGWQYNWVEKTITATAVTLGYLAGDVPVRLQLLIVFTNWLWIPVILSCDLRLRRDLRTHAGRSPGGTRQAAGATPASAIPD